MEHTLFAQRPAGRKRENNQRYRKIVHQSSDLPNPSVFKMSASLENVSNFAGIKFFFAGLQETEIAVKCNKNEMKRKGAS